MSFFSYNNIEANLIKTQSIDRSPKMSQDGTEYMYTEWTIDLAFVYNPGATVAAGLPDPVFPVQTDAAIRHALMQPRKVLIFKEGNSTLLEVDGLDENNGPTPLRCTITKIMGARLFFVQFSIRTWVIECGIGNDLLSAIASVRYGRSESLDYQYRSTVTVSGIAVFRSDRLAALGQIADAYRDQIIPPPLFGFIRTNVSFSMSSDGLKLEFIITEIEQFINLGNPQINGTAAAAGIIKMGMRYSGSPTTMGSIGLAGYGSHARIEADAEGNKLSNNYAMMKYLFAACFDKVRGLFDVGLFISDASISEDVFEKKVSISITFYVVPVDGDKIGWPLIAIPINGFVGAPIASLSYDPLNNQFPVNNYGGSNPAPPGANATRGFTPYYLAVLAFAESCYNTLGGDTTGTEAVQDWFSFSQSWGITPGVYGYLSPPQILNPTPTVRQRAGRSLGNGSSQSVTAKENSRRRIQTRNHYVQVPTASSPTPAQIGGAVAGCVILQLFQPTTELHYDWHATNFGGIPSLPNITPPASLPGSLGTPQTGQQFILSSFDANFDNVEVGPDGVTPIIRADGEAVYLLAQSFGPNDSVPIDTPSWIDPKKINNGSPINVTSTDYSLPIRYSTS